MWGFSVLFFWECTIYFFFFRLYVTFFSPKSYKEVLFIQHRIALSELGGLVPWLLHITDVLQVEIGSILWKMCYISGDQPLY